MKRKYEELNNDNDICPICLGNMGNKNLTITKCGHKFCHTCLDTHSCKDNKCPICREKILINDMDDYKEDEWREIINRNSVSVNENIPLPIVQALMFSIPRLPEDFHPS